MLCAREKLRIPPVRRYRFSVEQRLDAAERFPGRGGCPQSRRPRFTASKRGSIVSSRNHTTGVRRLRGSAFSRRHTSSPWMSGNRSFSRTKSGWRLGQRQAQLPRSVRQSHRIPGSTRVLPNRRNSMDRRPQPGLLRSFSLSFVTMPGNITSQTDQDREGFTLNGLPRQPADSPSGRRR